MKIQRVAFELVAFGHIINGVIAMVSPSFMIFFYGKSSLPPTALDLADAFWFGFWLFTFGYLFRSSKSGRSSFFYFVFAVAASACSWNTLFGRSTTFQPLLVLPHTLFFGVYALMNMNVLKPFPSPSPTFSKKLTLAQNLIRLYGGNFPKLVDLHSRANSCCSVSQRNWSPLWKSVVLQGNKLKPVLHIPIFSFSS